jgi:hypothetical protein
LLFQDEARLKRISDQRRCWVLRPIRSIVGHQIAREFVYGLAAVSPIDKDFCSAILPWVGTETMASLLAHRTAQFPEEHCLMLLKRIPPSAMALCVQPTLHLLPLPP